MTPPPSRSAVDGQSSGFLLRVAGGPVRACRQATYEGGADAGGTSGNLALVVDRTKFCGGFAAGWGGAAWLAPKTAEQHSCHRPRLLETPTRVGSPEDCFALHAVPSLRDKLDTLGLPSHRVSGSPRQARRRRQVREPPTLACQGPQASPNAGAATPPPPFRKLPQAHCRPRDRRPPGVTVHPRPDSGNTLGSGTPCFKRSLRSGRPRTEPEGASAEARTAAFARGQYGALALACEGRNSEAHPRKHLRTSRKKWSGWLQKHRARIPCRKAACALGSTRHRPRATAPHPLQARRTPMTA